MKSETTEVSYEELCSICREANFEMDQYRFLIGDTALVIESRYGNKTISDMAKDIGINRSTCYQYAAVAKFYPQSLRGRLREDMPSITYSFLRDAMRLKDIDLAVEFLHIASELDYTADQASRELTLKLGHQTRESAEGTLEGTTYYDGKHRIEISVSEDDLKWLTNCEQLIIRAK